MPGKIVRFQCGANLFKEGIGASPLDRLNGRHLLASNLRFCKSLDRLEFVNAGPGHKRDGPSFATGPSGSANPMDIVFCVVWQIVIHDEFKIVDVNAPCRYVSRDQKLKGRLFKVSHYPRALWLGHASVESLC